MTTLQGTGSLISEAAQKKEIIKALRRQKKVSMMLERGNQDFFRDEIIPIYYRDNRTTQEKLQDKIGNVKTVREEIHNILKDDQEVQDFMLKLEDDSEDYIRKLIQIFPLIYEKVKDLRLLTGRNLYDYCEAFITTYDANKLLSGNPELVKVDTNPYDALTWEQIDKMNLTQLRDYVKEYKGAYRNSKGLLNKGPLKEVALQIYNVVQARKAQPSNPVPADPVPADPVPVDADPVDPVPSDLAVDPNKLGFDPYSTTGTPQYYLSYLTSILGADKLEFSGIDENTDLSILQSLAWEVYNLEATRDVASDVHQAIKDANKKPDPTPVKGSPAQDAVQQAIEYANEMIRTGHDWTNPDELKERMKKSRKAELQLALYRRHTAGLLNETPYLQSFRPKGRYNLPELRNFLFVSLLRDPNYKLQDPTTHVLPKQMTRVRAPGYHPDEFDEDGNEKPLSPDPKIVHYGFGLGQNQKQVVTKVKYGRGIALENIKIDPSVPFGKFVIHSKQLEDHLILNVKYKSGSQIPALPRQKISEGFSEFLFDVLKSGKVNTIGIKTLSSEEKDLFYKMVKMSGLDKQIQLPSSASSPDDDVDRFNVLRGEIMAGNNSSQVKHELKGLVLKLINNGLINKTEGYAILNLL
jgi:hypothetical protein